ncbi:MAG: YraN family protein [Proteobacteria bacterium]|uniref:YraN family protein n=1 Tax=Cysteiniphilum sp. JM-1 TaxID=2610891 RepID=UPI0012462A73|nr:YraN family protein [Cysteiniphilum sp. JM-1]MDA0909951.1 YraN family protein [Pseudomonadota bacterium]
MSRAIGGEAENKALVFLETQGFSLIAKNFLTPLGEIDLIGQIADVLIFVEVKARKSAQFGSALEMVTKSKQIKVRKTAQVFLQQHRHYQHAECRFDVIGITGDEIQWVQAAF